MSDGNTMRVTRVPAPVRQQVVEQLRLAIMELRFPPGQRLIERELTELTGVSRPTIREALQQLAAEGLVTTTAGKGWVVASLTLSEARDLYAVRALLEGLAGRRFVERASEEQVADLRAVYEEMRSATDQLELSEIKDRFYEVLFDGAESTTVTTIITTLHARVTALRAISLSSPGRLPDTLEEIREVVEAIETRDSDRAEVACVEHVHRASNVVFAALAERDDESSNVAEALRSRSDHAG